jgi:hypothetical protein
MAQPSGNISLKEFFSLNWGIIDTNALNLITSKKACFPLWYNLAGKRDSLPGGRTL